MVEAVAQELGVSRATLYRLIARYRQTRTVEGLRGPGSGRSAGTRVLNSDVETLIREVLETEYLKPTRPPFQRVLEQIGGACRTKGWPERWCTWTVQGEMTPNPSCYEMTGWRRMESGRPASSIRFSTATPMAASVCWPAKPRARSRGPINAL
jgi:hypothetical protein